MSNETLAKSENKKEAKGKRAEFQKASELSTSIQNSYAEMMEPVVRHQELIDSMTKSTR